jgi:predicted nucleic-acid-binding Zn-ribbon protein
MGNICKPFNYNKEYYNTNKNTNLNTKPFLDISNNSYFDNKIEPPSYSEIYNIKNREYNNYII